MDLLKAMIRRSHAMVVLTGAGVSTLSGIPDFRSNGGLYSSKFNGLKVEDILSLRYFKQQPELFFSWARQVWYDLDAYQPNIIHTSLAKLEQKGYLAGLFTQNIDMLHKKAGSKRCYEVHGSAEHHHCTVCNSYYSYHEIASIVRSGEVPVCKQCKGIIKPDITFYGENLDALVLSRAYEMFSHCDLCLVLGSSLEVQPAASFPLQALENSAPLVIVNAQRTPLDDSATLRFKDLGQVCTELDAWLETVPEKNRL